MKPKALLLGLAASSLILAGCGGTTTSEQSSSSTSSSESSSSLPSSSNVSPEESWAATYDLKTIAELKTLAAGLTETSAERYYVAATIDEVTNPSYGQMVISDETGTLDVYGTYSADGEMRYSELEEKPVAGHHRCRVGGVHRLHNRVLRLQRGCQQAQRNSHQSFFHLFSYFYSLNNNGRNWFRQRRHVSHSWCVPGDA